MTISQLIDFLRRELAPTPGRGIATFGLTLACVVGTIPILTHRIPGVSVMMMIVMYVVTSDDTSATLVGSFLAWTSVTLGLGLALLALKLSLDLPWLRLCFEAAFLFGGLFLKRVLVIGALGTAIGLPGVLVMMLPNTMAVQGVPPSPEMLTEIVLWIWLCITLGLTINLGVHFLLASGDSLTALQKQLDTRLRVVGEIARELGDASGRLSAPLAASLASLATAGMSRALLFLTTASVTHAWARQRHDELAAVVTLVDRLVADAGALVTLSASSRSTDVVRSRLVRVADACERTRRAFAEHHRPVTGVELALGPPIPGATSAMPPVDDMERVLDQLALAAKLRATGDGGREEKPALFLPDAFTNPEYVQFAVKGALAGMICYVLFIGFDYPGIFVSVITCFVVSLSSIGSSTQIGLLRFGGAVVGGLMGLYALVYAFPNIDGIGGFWLVFGAGTAVAAWINFGSPRISYGGMQSALAYYKAVLQGFGPVETATIVRDWLIGVFFGLTVFEIVEYVLWPVRAADRMRQGAADVLGSLADLALHLVPTDRGSTVDVDALRRLISQQVAAVQGFIEASKFELGADDSERIQRVVGDAQIVFLILLALERERGPLPLPLREATGRLATYVATSLREGAERVRKTGSVASERRVDSSSTTEAFIRSLADSGGIESDAGGGRAALYRELLTAVTRLI